MTNSAGAQIAKTGRRAPIGILGGMGPEATVLLQRKLIDVVPAQDDVDHIPLLVDMNPQVPSRIAHLLEGTGESPAPTLAAMAQRLEAAGAAALAMPCNTAHRYADAIVGAARIPFLNMVELSADHAASVLGAGGRVGMLASPAVRLARLFDKAFERRGLAAVWPDEEDALLAAIREIKVTGPSDGARRALRQGSESLCQAGGAFQLIACSEFSLVAESVAPDARAVDTLDVLVEAIVAFEKGAGA